MNKKELKKDLNYAKKAIEETIKDINFKKDLLYNFNFEFTKEQEAKFLFKEFNKKKNLEEQYYILKKNILVNFKKFEFELFDLNWCELDNLKKWIWDVQSILFDEKEKSYISSKQKIRLSRIQKEIEKYEKLKYKEEFNNIK